MTVLSPPLATKPAMAERLLRSPLGALTQSPWLDPVGLFALKRLLFPLSRLWAAAGVAGSSVERFVEEAQLTGRLAQQRRLLERQLARHRAVRQHADAAEQAWQQAFFGATIAMGQHDAAGLAQIEANRLDAAHRLTMDRTGFAPLLLAGVRRQVNWRIPSAGEVEAIYGQYLADPAGAYAFPNPLPLVEQSPRIAGKHGPEWWLRFASPSPRLNDMAYAKVSEPHDARHAPTVIIGNGVCMEPEMMRGMIDASVVMVRLGFRVVELTSPWHGRRCPDGWYGGEMFFATAPLGQLDLFTAQARETAVVLDWCRQNFAGPVALAGISLGSFVAQLVASHSAHWPPSARPDALLLVTHTARMEEVVFESGLVESIGIPAALEKAGWSQQDMLRWAALMDPQGPPAISASRIVSVLGAADRVTPIGGGLDLTRRWNLPAENAFVLRQGHFGTPARLVRDAAPLRRLKAILDAY